MGIPFVALAFGSLIVGHFLSWSRALYGGLVIIFFGVGHLSLYFLGNTESLVSRLLCIGADRSSIGKFNFFFGIIAVLVGLALLLTRNPR